MEAFLRNDYRFSIMLDYQLDRRILNLPVNSADMHKYLQLVNRKLVLPMTLKIK